MENSVFRVDADFVKNVLIQNYGSRDVKIMDLQVSQGVNRGDNFLSSMWKISARYEICRNGERVQERVDWMCKFAPEDEASKTAVKEQGIFTTEINMLTRVIPKIEELFGQRLAARAIFASTEEYEVIVMEDLSKEGYILKNRMIGLDREHVLLTLEKLAKLHAGSVYLHESEPELIESFKIGIFNEFTPNGFYKMFQLSLLKLADYFETLRDEWCPRVAKKIRVVAENFEENIKNVYAYDPDEFCVLNHGDCWVNNLLFKETDSGKATDLRMVDYQMSIYGSPAIDIIYVLSTCPIIELRGDHFEIFTEYYLKELRINMEQLGCKKKPLTMEELKKSILKRRIYYVMAALILHPRMVADKSEVEDFSEFLESGISKMNVMKNPSVPQTLRKIVPLMDKMNIFD
ncbi:uncharacterized protein LOC107270775 isoform X2 [Cephus cinctus]|nr:uncharacterized protein LOC107270775 isoform X2 [Cephus cinctus]